MADDDDRISYFAEALKARGIEMEPWKLQAFAEKKDRGETEAQMLQEGNEGTHRFKSQLWGARVLQGTALGAVTVPVADWLKEGRPSWREAVKRTPKTATVGVVLGAVAGWAAGKFRLYRISDELTNRSEEYQRNIHEMEMAWTEALAKRAAQEPSAVSKDGGRAR